MPLPSPLPTVDIVMATDALTAEFTQIVRTQNDYRNRVDAIAAAVRRADPDTALTALIIALAASPAGA